MPSRDPVRFGLIGSGWITEQHLAAFARIDEAEVVAIADVPRERDRPGRGEALAEKNGVDYFVDYRRMLEHEAVEAVTVALPNSLHASVTMEALAADKHVVVEKPLCFTLEEADAILAAAAAKDLVVGYAEELCYCPKLVRAKALVQSGAIGRMFWLDQREIHGGPYSDWFFTPELAGGGALMDMGCHAIAYALWMFDNAEVKSVTAHVDRLRHRAPLDDHVELRIEFEGDRFARLLAGWTLPGGMSSAARLVGTEGVVDVDLLESNGLSMFSEHGAQDHPAGWSRPDFEWLWQNGYPQEMADFARAIRAGTKPLMSAEDGRRSLEIMWAAYVSAAERRTVTFPFTPPANAPYPAAPWLESR